LTQFVLIVAVVAASLYLPPRVRITTKLPTTAVCRGGAA